VRRRMARIDHVAFEAADPDGLAAFYERVFGARTVKAQGHPARDPDGRTIEAITYYAGDDPRRGASPVESG
jgi:catechol 2,3-dioxygenase-like lactoylglutathione lyase family enzyme